MFYLAKTVQAFGLADVAWALMVGFTGENAMGHEMRLAMIGLGIFWAGRLLERRAAG